MAWREDLTQRPTVENEKAAHAAPAGKNRGRTGVRPRAGQFASTFGRRDANPAVHPTQPPRETNRHPGSLSHVDGQAHSLRQPRHRPRWK